MKKNVSTSAIALLFALLMLISSFAILPSNVSYAQPEDDMTFTSGEKIDFTSDTEMQFKDYTSMQFWSGEEMKFSTDTEMTFRSGKTMQFWSGVQMKFRTNITMQFITPPDGVIEICDWIQIIWPIGYIPPECSWWEVLDPDTGKGLGEIHIDGFEPPDIVHIDSVWPGPIQVPAGVVIKAYKKIDVIQPCEYFEVHWPSDWYPEPCTWWEIIDPETGELTGYEFHVDWTNESCEFHVDEVIPGPYYPAFPAFEIWARRKIPSIKPCDYFVVEEPPDWWPERCTWWEIIAEDGQPTGYNFHVDWTNESCEFHIDTMDPGGYLFDFPVPYVIAEQKIEEIKSCDWFIIVDPAGFVPEPCSWWEVLDDTGAPTGLEFHVDVTDGISMFHVDIVYPAPLVIPPSYTVRVRKKIDVIESCEYFEVHWPSDWYPEPCTWWEIIDPETGELTGYEFHVDWTNESCEFHVDTVIPGPYIPPFPVYEIWARKKIPGIKPCDYFVVEEPPHWYPEPCTWWEIMDPETGEPTGYNFHIDWTNESCEFHVDGMTPGAYAFEFPVPYVIAEQKITEIKSCDWFIIVDPPSFLPERCSWWEILDDTGAPTGWEFHVDANDGINMFHVDTVVPDPLVIPPTHTVTVRKKIDTIGQCDWFKVDDPANTPEPCTWWEVLDSTGNPTGWEFHVGDSTIGYFHVDFVIPGPVPIPPTHMLTAEKKIDDIEPCDWFVVIDPPTGWVPEPCSWWEITSPDEWAGVKFHVDTSGSGMFHVDIVDDPIPPPPTPPPYSVTAIPYEPPPLPWYMKPPFPDYAPSGMPDFDQRQWGTYPWWDGAGSWSHCGPVAVANSLWWLDSQFETNTIPPPAAIDNYPLVQAYGGPPWDDHDPLNVPPLVEHLAFLMDTDGRRTGIIHSGTDVFDMEAGITHYLSWSGVNPLGDVDGDGNVTPADEMIVLNAMGSVPGGGGWDLRADIWPVTTVYPPVADNRIDPADLDLVLMNMGMTGQFYEHTVIAPMWDIIEEEVLRCQDVVLLIVPYMDDMRYDEGAHFVTVAGLNGSHLGDLLDPWEIVLSDPILDNAEAGGYGNVPVPHIHPGPEPPYITHNDASLVSHDAYHVIFDPCPGGPLTIMDYPRIGPYPTWKWQIEAAVITSPYFEPPDVAVIDVVTSKSGCLGVGNGAPYPVLCQGRTTKVNVTVENQGPSTESFDVTVYANNSIIKTYTVTSLAPSAQETRTVIWNATGWAKGNYTLKAVADQVPGEVDTADNTFIDKWVMVVCPGDLDNSGEVDITDVVMVTMIYRAKIGDPEYNACRDVVEDGVIDISDVVAVTGHYREVC